MRLHGSILHRTQADFDPQMTPTLAYDGIGQAGAGPGACLAAKLVRYIWRQLLTVRQCGQIVL